MCDKTKARKIISITIVSRKKKVQFTQRQGEILFSIIHKAIDNAGKRHSQTCINITDIRIMLNMNVLN